MRILLAIAAILLAALFTSGCNCCGPQAPTYQTPIVQPGQQVYCVPQAQVQPQLCCPPGTVPVQCR